MDSFLTLSNLFKQFQSFNQIIPAAYLTAYLKLATLNCYKFGSYRYSDNNKFHKARWRN